MSRFDCGDKDINEFLKQDAITYQDKKIAITTLFIYKEEVNDRREALKREKQLKSFKGREFIKNLILD